MGRKPGAKNRPESRRRNGAQLHNCLVCGAGFWVPRWQREAVKGGGKYCSRACKHEGLRGVEKVQGTRYVRPDGYVEIKTGVRRRELEHRVVATEMLGRPLAPNEHVHHRNGVRDDNRPANLEVLTKIEHARRHDHPQTRPRRVALVCQRCGEGYEVKASKASGSRYCSTSCRLAALHEGNRKER